MVMDLAARKYRLMEQLMKVANSDTLEKLENLLKKETNTTDPYDDMPEPIKRLLAKSKEDSNAGRVRPHEEVMAEIKAKYNLS